jgi:hypothetical protein
MVVTIQQYAIIYILEFIIRFCYICIGSIVVLNCPKIHKKTQQKILELTGIDLAVK